MSKNVGSFAQNLALRMYWAEELSKRSVTGRNYTGKDKPERRPKPAVSPLQLKFIYNAVKERIAQKVGDRNHAQIEALGNKTIINRALAEKIGNLNKSRKLASLRNAESKLDKPDKH